MNHPHEKIMDLFRKHLIIEGMPDAINNLLETKNIVEVRKNQNDIHDFYGDDASKYDQEHKLQIIRIYDLIPSRLENKKKRIVAKDVGMLTGILYHNNIQAVLNDERSINLGSVYECFAACELKAHGHKLFYYDNKTNGEVDFLIDDYQNLSVAPLEIKSGKDYFVSQNSSQTRITTSKRDTYSPTRPR
jgi:uncharacterized protein